ncbi:MAG: type 1 glutamine amidotransferase [Gammaproteobacteria bacterium]
MRVHVLQHVPFEGLGSIEGWLVTQGASVTYTRFYESAILPNAEDVDFVIALGGPMSVNDEHELPWLVEEKRFVASAIHADKTVLGICLGSQLIASALGSGVYPGPFKEIGWFPVRGEPPTSGSFRFPASVNVFHWHGETFDLPPSAVHLASSEACRNQAFQIGRRVFGLQFHLETTPSSAEALISECSHELITDRFIQTAEQLRAVPASEYVSINTLMDSVLSYLTRIVA